MITLVVIWAVLTFVLHINAVVAILITLATMVLALSPDTTDKGVWKRWPSRAKL